MSRRARIWTWIGASLPVFLLLVGVISIQVLKSAWFANYVRGKIVSETEDSTGGKVEIGSFAFNWRHLDATVENFILHGTEPAGTRPLFQAKKIEVRLKLLSLHHIVDIDSLRVEQPAANIITFPDGKTNFPEPKVKSNNNTLQTIVDLAIRQFEVTNGNISYAGQDIGFSGRGENLQIQLFYRAAPAGYQGNIRIAALQLASRAGQPLNASVDLPVEIGKDNVDLKNAVLATRDSRIVITGSLSHLAAPQVDAHVTAHLSLAELRRATNLNMDACQRDTPCFADADVQARAGQHGIEISSASLKLGQSGLEASGNDFHGNVSLDELGRLFQIQAGPHGDVTISGKLQNPGTETYAINGNITAHNVEMRGFRNINLSTGITVNRDRIALEKLRLDALGGELDGNAALTGFSQLQFHGQLRSLQIREFEKRAGPFYDGVVNGNIEAGGNIKAPHVAARLSIVPGSQGMPVSGRIQAAYDTAKGAIEMTQSYVALPHSRLDFSGVLGSRITADFNSTGLDDLYPALYQAEKQPPAAMPVSLNGGKLSLHAEVTGSLASPRVASHVDVTRFSVENRPFDRLTADLSLSPSGAAVTNGALTRPGVQAQFAGSMGLRQWSPESDSPLALTVDMRNGDIADVLALAGESAIRARGSVDLSAQINGTVGNPQGSAHVLAANGAMDGQAFDKVEANIDFLDQLIRLTSLDVTAQSARLQASGTYTHPRDSLLTGRAQVHLTGTGVELSQITVLDQQHPGLAGSAQMNAEVTGDVQNVAGETQFAPANIQADFEAHGLRDKRQSYGDLTAQATTTGRDVNFNLNSNLAGAAIKVSGRTTLTKDYPTTADASIQNLQIENALMLAGETFPGKGLVNLNGRFSGTIREPAADARISVTGANVYGEPINSLQTTVRYSSRSLEIPSLRLVTPAGELTLNGSFTHPENQFDSGTLAFHAQSDGLKLAQVRNLQERKAGIGGTLKLVADFAGAVKARDISVSAANARVNLAGVTYAGHNYGDANLTAETKGNMVDFHADSGLAGASIQGSGEMKLQGDYPVTAKLTLANLRFSNLRGMLGGDAVRPDFEALLEGDVTLAGEAKKPKEITGKLDVTRLELSTSPNGKSTIALKNEGPMVIDYANQSVRVQSAHLTGKSTDISIGGTVALAGGTPFNLTVKANTNLGLLQEFERDIHASGEVAVNAVVRGNISQPLVNGTVTLKNASFNMDAISNGLTNANGVIALNGTGASIRMLTAESGGGKVSVTGFAALNGTALSASSVRYSLTAKADHVRTRYQGISVVNSATLALGGTLDRSLVSGNITVERVAYNPQSDLGSMLSQLSQPEVPDVSGDVSGPASTMRLAVRIRTAPDVQFETTMAQVLQANADLNLVGTVQQPGMVGRVNITQGDLIFFGNEYTVDRGIIAFTNPNTIDPRVTISLETTVQSVVVTLGISGPMNDLKLSYHSDPPLRFDEIVGMLAMGTQPTSDPNILANETAPPQQSVANMGETAIVSQAVASPLTSRLQRVFGVSQLSINPTFVSGTAVPDERVTLQQRVANAVTFTYTQDLSQSNSELVRVEWAINSRFSAVATRDENGIFGVDFFYKRQFR